MTHLEQLRKRINEQVEKGKELLESAKEFIEMEGQYPQKLVEECESGKCEKTEYLVEDLGDSCHYFYGTPVLEDGKLQGFNMYTFTKYYDEFGSSTLRTNDREFKNEKDEQVFLTVDQFLDLRSYAFGNDKNLRSLLKKVTKNDTIEDLVINSSKLAKIRKKISGKIDKKLGTDLADKKLVKPLKKIEKIVSDIVLGRAKE